MSARLPRDLHPIAWWVWAIGLAAGASLSTNPVWMVMLIGAATGPVDTSNTKDDR